METGQKDLNSSDDSIDISLIPGKSTVEIQNKESLKSLRDSIRQSSSELLSLENFSFNDQVGKLKELNNIFTNSLQAAINALNSHFETHFASVQSNISAKETQITSMLLKMENEVGRESEVERQTSKSALLDKYAEKNINKQLQNLFEIHESFQISITSSIVMYKNFIKTFDFDTENYFEKFLFTDSEIILESWVLNNIDFCKIDVDKIIRSNLVSKQFCDYLAINNRNKFTSLIVDENDDPEKASKLINDNSQVIENVSIRNLDSRNSSNMLFKIGKVQNGLEKMKKLKFENCNMINITPHHTKDIAKLVPNLKKLCFVSSHLNCFINFSFFTWVRKLNLTNCLITQNCLTKLFKFTSNSFRFLEELNLANNNITVFSLAKAAEFPKLTSLSLQNNLINEFSTDNLKRLPSLQYLNLSGNSFTSLDTLISYLKKEKVIITLVNYNQFFIRHCNYMQTYLAYMSSVFRDSQFGLKKLNMNYMFSQKNFSSLTDMNFNYHIRLRMKNLFLSHNHLTSEVVIAFFEVNGSFFNLKKLKLNSNRLDDRIVVFFEKNCNKLFDKIEFINLNNNAITSDCVDNMLSLVKTNTKLIVLLKKTPFSVLRTDSLKKLHNRLVLL